MMLFTILLAGLSYVSALTKGDLQADVSAFMKRDLQTNAPCLTLQKLSFDSTDCTQTAVMAVVAKEFASVSCPAHNLRQEIRLLTGSSDNNEAKFILTQVCKGESYQACTSWDDVVVNGCDFKTIMDMITSKVAEAGATCTHNDLRELMFLTKSKNRVRAQSYIDLMCKDAWNRVARTKFTDVDDRFDDTFMSEYFDGKTFLNSETGNFQGNPNPAFPASDASITAGASVNAFRNGGAQNTVLTTGIPDLRCQNQAMLCCFGRDRQSNDNNGNCADNDCADKGPADNSNLCFTDFPTIVPFPNESEGAIHCHGVAWGSDDNGFEAQFKYNNLFFVSMFDHMYTRGYVEKTVPNEFVPMCGCIEDMPPVSRADCTQVNVMSAFSVSQDSVGSLYAEPSSELKVNYAACQGIDFTTGAAANNDLASYANVLVRDGKMKPRSQRAIFDTLVGFRAPGDNANEQSCRVEYRKATGGLTYPKA